MLTRWERYYSSQIRFIFILNVFFPTLSKYRMLRMKGKCHRFFIILSHVATGMILLPQYVLLFQRYATLFLSFWTIQTFAFQSSLISPKLMIL